MWYSTSACLLCRHEAACLHLSDDQAQQRPQTESDQQWYIVWIDHLESEVCLVVRKLGKDIQMALQVWKGGVLGDAFMFHSAMVTNRTRQVCTIEWLPSFL